MAARPRNQSQEGKRSKLTPARLDRFLRMLARGVGKLRAARAIRVDYSGLWKLMQKDKSFAEAVERAELEAIQEVESALWQQACIGRLGHIVFFLTNRAADRWQDRRNLVPLQASGSSMQQLVHVLHQTFNVDNRKTAIAGVQDPAAVAVELAGGNGKGNGHGNGEPPAPLPGGGSWSSVDPDPGGNGDGT